MNVYVIASEGGMCKIGKANNPAARVSALSTGHPYKLSLAHVFSLENEMLAFEIERRAHAALAPKRMQGEWFAVSPSEARDVLIRLCPAAPPPPLPDLEEWHMIYLNGARDSLAQAQDLLARALVSRKFDVTLFTAARGAMGMASASVAHVERNVDDDI